MALILPVYLSPQWVTFDRPRGRLMSLEGKVFKATDVAVLKDLGLVVGRAVICTEKGQDYFDLQGDNVPLIVSAKAFAEFFENQAVHKVMHEGQQVGELSGWMLVCEATKSILKIQSDWEGIAVIMKPDPVVLKGYEDGTYAGFSIGGTCSYVEVSEAA